MGSTLKFMTFKCHSPVFLVIKFFTSVYVQSKFYYERNEYEQKGFKFLVCLDGSQKGEKLLNVASDLMSSKNDELHAATVSESERQSKVVQANS